MKTTYAELLDLLKQVREDIDEYDDERGYCLYYTCNGRFGAQRVEREHDSDCIWVRIDKAIHYAEEEQ